MMLVQEAFALDMLKGDGSFTLYLYWALGTEQSPGTWHGCRASEAGLDQQQVTQSPHSGRVLGTKKASMPANGDAFERQWQPSVPRILVQNPTIWDGFGELGKSLAATKQT